MKIIVAVIVYDRYDNVKEWIRCFKQSDTKGSELVIIHNYKDLQDRLKFKELCDKESITYVQRRNIGYDIGAFQDVCRERLKDFPNDWNYLFWMTDDTIPMKKNFINLFLNEMIKPNVGVACLEISREVKIHIRTSSFMLSKQTATLIKFPADPVVTKTQCFEFEHRGKNAFYEQITALGKKVIQVSPVLKTAYLWDTHSRGHLRRWEEHYKEFTKEEILKKSDDKVLFICPIYNSYPQIISSLICQTHENWELLLIHDGPNNTGLDKIISDTNDKRIRYMIYPERKNDWGHSLRRWALEEIKNGGIKTESKYIVITNPDNYYVPIFIEEMLKGFVKPYTIATYCSSFVHGYLSNQLDGTYRFGVLQTKLELGWIDCGGVMVKKQNACEVGWRSLEIYSDWTYFKALMDRFGKNTWNKVLGCLFVHN